MNEKALKEEWLGYEKLDFEGWDFSLIQDEWENEPLPWDYAQFIYQSIHPEFDLLDMGTGGGEFLQTLNHPYEKTSVTEGWQPNIDLLKKKLVPLGVKLAEIDEDDIIHFEDQSFNIVTNRHESFRIDEVKRVLKQDGVFITQQVGGENGNRLSNKLIPNFQPRYKNFHMSHVVDEFKENGFTIQYAEEYFPEQKFFTMKALIYYAKVIKWEFPGFHVESHFERLLDLYKELQMKGCILNREHRFMIVATR